MDETRLPAETFHLADMIEEEMEARGWDRAELAARMTQYDLGINSLALDYFMDLRDPDLTPDYDRLSYALGVSKGFLERVHAQWLAAKKREAAKEAGRNG